MQLSVLGAGYLGAVHATCMAHLGHEVAVYDVDPRKIDLLANGETPFFEPGFDELLKSTLSTGRLLFTGSPEEAIQGAEVHFICVGTPQLPGADAADIRYVDAAFGAVVSHADRAGTIVGKSTVPVGTARRLAVSIAERRPPVQLDIAWNPEFLREGSAIEDTLSPDRLVFGVDSPAAEETLRRVYERLLDDGVPFITTDLPTAEMAKVAANSFLATKISFINAMAEICEVANADVVTLSRVLGFDDRIGAKFLNAGLGFGGGCLPKDIRAFSARAGELGAGDAVGFLSEVDKINLRRRERLVSLVETLAGGSLKGSVVAVLGAAFKPNSDDVRDSPALHVAAAMQVKGASVRVHDPRAIPNARERFPTLTFCDDVKSACGEADVVVLATEWDDYRRMDPSEIVGIVRRPVLVDARNALDHGVWAARGWEVHALGRGNLHPR